ncbi:MAG: dockerin type I domain-containing protein [Gemmatimonadota bacterium]|nr:dockerin type I domain-containing protein [Gemmatimonadota bacterium]
MYKVKLILSFVTFAAFLVAVGVGGVDAGALADKKLLVDTVIDGGEENSGVNVITPSMAMAGDTVSVELFVEDGGGNTTNALEAIFGARTGEMMIEEGWQIVGLSKEVYPLQLRVGPDVVQVAGLPGAEIPDNGYIGTVSIVVAADAVVGLSFYLKSAVIGLDDGSLDSLDVSGAALTFGQRIQLRLDTRIESPPQSNNALELPEMAAGDTIRFQLFAPSAAAKWIWGMQVELELRGKAFGSYVSGMFYAAGPFEAQLLGSDSTLAVASLGSATIIPTSGYLGQIDLSVSSALTSSDVLSVKSALIGTGDVARQLLDVSEAVLTFGHQMQLRLDTRIESPPQYNNAAELPEQRTGDTIQFQLFVPDAGGRQIQAYTIELALKGKTFGSYIDDASGMDLTGAALISVASGSGNPTLSMLSLSALTVPSSGYLGQVTLSVSRALTSSDLLAAPSASIAGPAGVQNLDVSQATLTFTAAACPGDFDSDGTVSLGDFLLFARAFGTRSGDSNYDARFDMDGSGAIDLSDFLAFAGVFGTPCP